jgi:hypothetical protein
VSGDAVCDLLLAEPLAGHVGDVERPGPDHGCRLSPRDIGDEDLVVEDALIVTLLGLGFLALIAVVFLTFDSPNQTMNAVGGGAFDVALLFSDRRVRDRLDIRSPRCVASRQSSGRTHTGLK